MTILHNCDCHTFEQVVTQLQKAIACSEAEGWEIAWQVHNTGKAVVKIGPEAECVRVGNILASIGPSSRSSRAEPHRHDTRGDVRDVMDDVGHALGVLPEPHAHFRGGSNSSIR